MAHTRRAFITTAAAAGSLVILSPEEVLAVLQGGVYVRQNVNTLTQTSPDIVAYKKGIKAMIGLASTNPLNWNYWANTHGIGPTPPALSGTHPTWNTCQHGGWWFLPWHRMYLAYFERTIRKLSATPSFSLPFWDYTAGASTNPNADNFYPALALPLIFRKPNTAATNPLFIPQRGNNLNSLNPVNTMPPGTESSSVAMATLNFTGPTGTANSFGSQTLSAPNHGASPHGRLESSPHDSVHGAIGGYMGSFGTAARDPIFWCHHANIDRLWNFWFTLGGGRKDPNSSAWCNQLFQFYNENGTLVGVRVRDIINAQAQLNYRYAGEPPQVTQTCPATIVALPPVFKLAERTLALREQTQTLGDQPVSVAMRIASAPMRDRMRAAAADATKTLVLRIEGIHAPQHPGVVWEVYVGLGANERPDPKGSKFVGIFSTFGAEHAGGEGHTVAFIIDRATADALKDTKGDTMAITFVPRGSFVKGEPQPVRVLAPVTFTRIRVVEE
ncbi:MAG TPA: tyrosinase family protein [Thermoanaerobaculia bacterium]|nr:tyrosinase family protein [Thermoanaerobaculia bacterium]